MGKTNVLVVIGLVVFVLGAVAFIALPGFRNDVTSLWPGAGVQSGQKVTIESVDENGIYNGNINLILNQQSVTTNGAVTPTTPVYSAHGAYPRPGGGLTALTVGGTTYYSSADFVYLSMFGGTDYLQLPAQLVASNPGRVESAVWDDWDQDGTIELVAKVKVGDLRAGIGQTPALMINVPLVAQDVALATTSPADVTGVGTNEKVETITWTLSGLTLNDGVAITQLYFVTNATRETAFLKLEDVWLSGGWVQNHPELKTHWTNPLFKEQGSAYVGWYIQASDSTKYNSPATAGCDGPQVYMINANGSDDLMVRLNIRCHFGAAQAATITLHAMPAGANGAGTELTDQVKLST